MKSTLRTSASTMLKPARRTPRETLLEILGGKSIAGFQAEGQQRQIRRLLRGTEEQGGLIELESCPDLGDGMRTLPVVGSKGSSQRTQIDAPHLN
jgi:hypothetical protein